MSRYIRARAPGGTFFFTVHLADRGSATLVTQIALLGRAYAATLLEHPFHTDAIVVLPDHLHAIWTLPAGDSDFPVRWRKIKARFTHWYGRSGMRSRSKIVKRERGIWQRRYWEHRIRDAGDYRRHLQYCLGNPVHHRLCACPADWPHSSIHRDIGSGRLGPDWCYRDMAGAFGE